MIAEDLWQAIARNDKSYDGKFYYAVTTTGIFCRPSCRSKLPSRQHVRIFTDSRQAAAENFRPCKRCKPDGNRQPDEEWVEQIAHWIGENYAAPLTLKVLADTFHGSPGYLQRTFKRMMGLTPVHYIQRTRISKAREELAGTDKSVTEIAETVGIPNAAYFATIFQKITGLSPTGYRRAAGSGNRNACGGV